jgi:hypothetical protein
MSIELPQFFVCKKAYDIMLPAFSFAVESTEISTAQNQASLASALRSIQELFLNSALGIGKMLIHHLYATRYGLIVARPRHPLGQAYRTPEASPGLWVL